MCIAATSPAPPTTGRAACLLSLVRRLIDYGRDLASALRQRGAAALGATPRRFGTGDIALILARIALGLHRAGALEARLTRDASRLDAEPRPPAAPLQRQPRAARTATQADAAGADPAQLPTPEQIAAAVCRRPIGAVLADICRDLGILPNHPLWPELQQAIARYGGSLARLLTDTLDRLLPRIDPATRRPAWPAPAPAPAATGPP